MHGCSTARISSPQASPDGEAESIQIVETAATFVIDWKGNYRINAPAFVDSDRIPVASSASSGTRPTNSTTPDSMVMLNVV